MIDPQNVCQSCGACCSYSPEWPRFSMESDAVLARIPDEFVNLAQTGMRCEGTRCSALTGTIGISTACGIYHARPEVCRDCLPGDDACNVARLKFGLVPLSPT